MAVLTVSLNEIKRLIPQLYVLSLKMMAHVRSFKYFLRETFFKSINQSVDKLLLKESEVYLDQQSLKILEIQVGRSEGQNACRKEMSMLNIAVSSLGPYFDIPILWKLFCKQSVQI